MTRPAAGPVQAVPVPGGPLLLRGAQEVLDQEGRVHPVRRPVVALCTCELSQRKPWCDGTHKVAAGTPGSSKD